MASSKEVKVLWRERNVVPKTLWLICRYLRTWKFKNSSWSLITRSCGTGTVVKHFCHWLVYVRESIGLLFHCHMWPVSTRLESGDVKQTLKISLQETITEIEVLSSTSKVFQRDWNPWPLRCWCNALPAELVNLLGSCAQWEKWIFELPVIVEYNFQSYQFNLYVRDNCLNFPEKCEDHFNLS